MLPPFLISGKMLPPFLISGKILSPNWDLKSQTKTLSPILTQKPIKFKGKSTPKSFAKLHGLNPCSQAHGDTSNHTQTPSHH
jgi:hypothetical protein